MLNIFSIHYNTERAKILTFFNGSVFDKSRKKGELCRNLIGMGKNQSIRLKYKSIGNVLSWKERGIRCKKS
jgi:hypothetical protein